MREATWTGTAEPWGRGSSTGVSRAPQAMAESPQQGLKLQAAVLNDWGHGPPHLLHLLLRNLEAQWLPLGMHPRCKFGTILKLRTVSRGMLFASPSMFKRLCHVLRAHRNDDVRAHVSIMVARGRAFWLDAAEQHLRIL